MKISAFKHYDLSQAKRYQMTVDSFGGVDYSSQRFLVADSHAIDMKNFVYRNGIVQKRHGLDHLLTIKTVQYIPSDFSYPSSPLEQRLESNESKKSVNGVWSVLMEDGNVHTYAHIGRLMYELSGFSDGSLEAELISNGTATANWQDGDGYDHPLCYEFEDFKSSAFVGGNKLWFLGGNKYMCLRHTEGGRSFQAVENSDLVPIPTTAISITARNAVTSQRVSLDAVNLLTQWRKNELLSGVPIDEEAAAADALEVYGYLYQLDAPIIGKDVGDVLNTRITIHRRKA